VRVWLGAALLLACFALALALLRRAEPPPAGPQPAAPLPPGWGSVVLGAPSDALPPAAAPQPAQPAPAPVPQPEPPAAREFELSVSPGQTLSTICREHYGTASAALVAALARFNGMASADALQAGQKLKLPPLATLQKP
jgi:nucleoid-associated protein YgaU